MEEKIKACKLKYIKHILFKIKVLNTNLLSPPTLVLGIEPKDLGLPSLYSMAELHPQRTSFFPMFWFHLLPDPYGRNHHLQALEFLCSEHNHLTLKLVFLSVSPEPQVRSL